MPSTRPVQAERSSGSGAAAEEGQRDPDDGNGGDEQARSSSWAGCCSARPSAIHGIAISTVAKATSHFQQRRTGDRALRQCDRQQQGGREQGPGQHQLRGRQLFDRNLDQQVGDAPGHAKTDEAQQRTTTHAAILRPREP